MWVLQHAEPDVHYFLLLSCHESYLVLFLNSYTGLALITTKEALLWTDGRYFLQATNQLSDRWRLMRMGEDPPVEVWIADVSIDHLPSHIFRSIF